MSLFDLDFPVFMGPEHVWKAALRLQIETVALMTKRAQAYSSLPGTLEHCQSPTDFMTEQVRFWQIAQRHYQSSFERACGVVPAPGPTAGPDAKSRMPHDYITVAEIPAARAPEPVKAPARTDRAATPRRERRTA